MKKVHLILLSLLIYMITLVYIVNQPHFSYSKGDHVLSAIPLMYWVLLIVNSVVLVGIIYYINTNRYIVSLTGLMYGFLFYVTNLYFIIPYEQSDTSPSAILGFMLSSGKITHETLATPALSYLSYPISFILATALMLVGKIGKIGIYTVGLFVFIGVFYIGLIYYYDKLGKDIKFAVMSLMTYIILSFYVINDQVVPQTLALAFLPYLYKVTFDFIEKGQKLKRFLILTIFWFTLVFTHPFMFLFYILPVSGIVLYYQFFPQEESIKTSTIGLLVSIWGLGFILSFYNLLSIPLRGFIASWGKMKGETWWVFVNFLRKFGAFGPVQYIPHPHYELIHKWVVDLQAWTIRAILIGLLLIATYGLVSHLKHAVKKRQLSHQLIFDLSVLISSGALFVLGLVTSFLGQRVFQVAFIPFSRYVLQENTRRYLKISLVVIMIVTPLVYTFNTLTNLTVTSHMFVRDPLTLQGELFLQKNTKDNSYVFTGTDEFYPTKGYRYNAITWIRANKFSISRFNYILWSKEVELALEYYGFENSFNKYVTKENRVYTDGFVSVIYGGRHL